MTPFYNAVKGRSLKKTIITEDLCVSFLIWKMVLDINDFIPLVKGLSS